MAEKKTSEKNVQRIYNVPLRKEYLKVPNWKRTKKAVVALQQFMQRHMKSDNVKLAKEVNEKLWQHGIKNPPHHIKVTASKDEKGVVMVTLFGVEEKSKKLAKKEKAKKVKDVPKQTEKKEQPEKVEVTT